MHIVTRLHALYLILLIPLSEVVVYAHELKTENGSIVLRTDERGTFINKGSGATMNRDGSKIAYLVTEGIGDHGETRLYAGASCVHIYNIPDRSDRIIKRGIVFTRISTPMDLAHTRIAWVEELGLRGAEAGPPSFPRVRIYTEATGKSMEVKSSPTEDSATIESIGSREKALVIGRRGGMDAAGNIDCFRSSHRLVDGRIIDWIATYDRRLFEAPSLDARFLGTFEFDNEAVCLDAHEEQQNFSRNPAGPMLDYWYLIETASGTFGWAFGHCITLSWEFVTLVDIPSRTLGMPGSIRIGSLPDGGHVSLFQAPDPENCEPVLHPGERRTL